MIKVMIVDDHPVVRSGLEAMLSVEDDIEVVAAEAGATAALAVLGRKVKTDLVITDVRMPDGDGFELLGAVRNGFPKTKVLLLAGMPLADEEARAREDGACGYLPKSSDGQRLVSFIRAAVKPDAEFISETFQSNAGVLSERELTVLRYAAEGKTRDEIALILGNSPDTIKVHLKAIMRKLDTVNTVASVSRAYALGILRA